MKVIFYDWGGLNVWLFHLINNVRFDYLDSAMLAGTALANHQLFTVYIAAFSLLAFIAIARAQPDNQAQYRAQTLRWMSAIAVFSIAYVLDGWLLTVLKPLLDFPRPPLALPVGTQFIVGQPEYHHSLPSGHASFAMLVVASTWPVLARWQKIGGIVFVVWVGLSRISLGAHFPADVLAGWLSSLLLVLLVSSIVSNMHTAKPTTG